MSNNNWQPLISVIVPVYNVEHYLKKCLVSIQKQTFKEIEIIVINDGSTDKSLYIANQLAKYDQRIKLYSKENGGLSSARNYGIDKATADYVTFVDSDDYIAPDMVELLYNNMIRENADISMCSLYDVFPSTEIGKDENVQYLVVNNEEALRILFEAKLTSVYAVAKLYRKELFKEIRYPVGRIAEDAFVIVDLLGECEKIVIETAKKYYYVHRENSITTSEYSPKNWDVIDAYQRNYEIIRERYPNLLGVAQMRMCWAYFFVLDKLATSKNVDKETENKVVKYLRKHFLFIMKDNCFSSSRKIAACVLMINKDCYKRLVRLFVNRRGINP